MKSNKILWITEIKALRPCDGQMTTFCGPEIEAPTLREAQEYIDKNMPWCWLLGQLVCEIPCIEGTHDPDFDNSIDYKEVDNQEDDISGFFK